MQMGLFMEPMLVMEQKETLPQCQTKGCNRRTPSIRSRFCEPCAQARRSVQLVVNNQKWKMKIEAGEAGHRLLYRGQPTEWAKKNPIEAVKMAVKEGYNDEALEQLLRGLL